MSKQNNPSSVSISKEAQSKLKKIAFFTNHSQTFIIEDFIDQLYGCMGKDFIESANTGEYISYLVNVKSTCGVSPIVSGVFQVPINLPVEDSNTIRDELIQKQFAQIDAENETRKTIFQEALKND